MPYQIPYLELGTDDVSLHKVVEACQGQFVKGSVVQEFEKAFSSVIRSGHCITTGSGTDALFIALKSLNIQPGDEVLTPALSWISSAETISLCHAKPVFVDVDEDTYTIDAKKIEAKITSKTKAIIAVHLYGHAADVVALKKICDQHKLFLIEDCAQAHLTTINQQVVGTLGDAGAFSFYPTKNLGAWGDAGCVVTNNSVLAEKMRRFGNHGALQKEDHTMEGMNSRMDSLQAAVLLQRLPNLESLNEKRLENAAYYTRQLQGIQEIVLPKVKESTTHTFHIYAIRAQNRDALKAYLADQGIQTLIHYSKALPFLTPYKHLLVNEHDYPVSSVLQDELLSLPIHPAIKQDQMEYICNHIRKFFQRSPFK